MKNPTFKKGFLFFWLFSAIFSLGLYVFRPDLFTAESIAVYVAAYGVSVYFVVSILRGFALIPSTPFVLAGVYLFPDSLFSVLVISLVGILASATLIFYFSEYMGFDKILTKKYPQRVSWIQEKMNTQQGVFFVLAWSFFPAVPTDLVCYAAGTVKMSYAKFILAVFIGELILVAAYIYLSDNIFSIL